MEGSKAKVALFDDLVFRLFGRLIARQFVVFGGVPTVLARGRALRKKRITPTYNRIDEHVKTRKRVDEVLLSYLEILANMDQGSHGNLAIKPSAFGIAFGPFFFARTLHRLIDAAAGKRIEIEVDAEDRETLVSVQSVLSALQKRLPDGVTLRPAFQMHLPDQLRRELIEECGILDMPVRIVKGSGLYNIGAPELSNDEVLARYYDTFRRQIARGVYPAAATVRDAKLLLSIAEMTRAEHVTAEQFSFQFLDGPFGRSLARTYAAKGYRVGCYVTFVDPSAPDEWKGYVQRRIAFGRKLLFGG
ncbi:MAG: hypothetical protein A3C93_06330 [Candidatus Lloydbacteria bacterium RIFCSPHIGHO2_02_FULL_54_17]|uniref:Proline dehydrogenase domain-containing protein n=1 Tax=Candidatus Lloydbacteria bacterium RIFCSPHIGHO2_02_FULL_54_17 TaxID=1798664 RepID=A0A1G2DGA4_9BACT|nr:MAG: hypothetical protein A2762_01345 [Candidatus Lloydbacteria bacterium RIFCSPHIGHO2_01_FULL_54_11]OGZ12694.1 MAG: hypothetical protein A3C93_06330 [Candidatus Lloydbacteria bacterium RIFCSPHIGHO2_02_FULL_54_17]OGZ13546.1 MAG: hypothetical protein A2948_04995 [Candidatus Lloydbacteria bacterium RIFCSPLOWO2_01_FULL_54_18]OGZ16216.1 MAG: hypothetical protein A3H76_03825 [Candidatus Lloydbacteria bacterium RIFCSPLOWO2_02_FULL_54_12]